MFVLMPAPLVLWPLLVVAQAAEQPKQPMVAGLPLVEWSRAADFYDREAIVYGRVVMTRNIGTYAFLNFHSDYRWHFTVVVRGKDFDAFPERPERMYDDKLVAVRGKVVKYRDKPEIVIESPTDMVILPDKPDDLVAAIKAKMGPALSAAGSGTALAGVGVPGRLTVATLNLASVIATHSGFCQGAQPPSDALRQAADVLKTFKADVVAVQWGESLDCLQRYNEKLLAGLGYASVIGHADAQGKVSSALLSRPAVSRSEAVAEFKTRKGETAHFRHAALRAEIQLSPSDLLTFFVIRMPGDAEKMSTSQVRAEAKGLRQLFDEALASKPDSRLLVCGGFAGKAGSRALAALEGKGDSGLSVPGYAASTGGKEQTPLIAQIRNFILANGQAAALYAPGSTRVEQGESYGSAAAISLKIGEAYSPEQQSSAKPTAPKPNSDF